MLVSTKCTQADFFGYDKVPATISLERLRQQRYVHFPSSYCFALLTNFALLLNCVIIDFRQHSNQT